MSIFNRNYVTVIRKKDGLYISDNITTIPVLPTSNLTAEQNRNNTIARLRKDETVLFVLEDHDGKCEERAELDGGYEMTITLQDGEEPSASILVSLNGETIYLQDFVPEQEEEYGDYCTQFLCEVKWVLGCIDRRDLESLEDEDDPDKDESETPLRMFDIENILERHGFQYEVIRTVERVNDPCLFVLENEVALISSRHLAGTHFFVELKRIFEYREKSTVEAALSKVQYGSDVEVVSWPDGTWSFRLPIENCLEEDEFLEQLLMRVKELREFVQSVEGQSDLYETYCFEMTQIRQYFIYESIDAALKLSQILI